MSTMESLNSQYVKAVKITDILCQYEGRIRAEMDSREQNDIVKANRLISLLQQLSTEVDCSEFGLLKDTILIGNQYKRCFDAIALYKTILINYGSDQTKDLFDAMEQIRQAQNQYDNLKDAFLQKYSLSIDSVKELNQTILTSTRESLSKVQDDVNRIKDKAREMAGAEYTVELRQTDPITIGNVLPTELLVARLPVKGESMQIMRDMGMPGIYQNIHTDLRNQGNVMVLSDFENMEDRRIDEFIIAYVIRFIESFPLGTVNVHIFDQNTNYLYKRLSNSFQSENSGEIAKKIVQIHTTYSDLATFRDVNCEDIFRKTSVSRPDLFAIYEEDRSDPFNLIILRDGLVDGSG